MRKWLLIVAGAVVLIGLALKFYKKIPLSVLKGIALMGFIVIAIFGIKKLGKEYEKPGSWN